MEKWAFKYAKKYDDDGRLAYLGMLKEVEDRFDMHYENSATEYILETFLECYDDEMTFQEYLSHCRIWTEEDLEDKFGDIWKECLTYERFCEYMGYFYPDDAEYVFEWEHGVFSTWIENADFEKDRKRINWPGIMMECERLITMLNYENKYGIVVTEKMLNSVAEVIAEYGYDIRNDFDFKTADDMLERYHQVFGGII